MAINMRRLWKDLDTAGASVGGVAAAGQTNTAKVEQGRASRNHSAVAGSAAAWTAGAATNWQSNEVIKGLQNALKKVGYDPGPRRMFRRRARIRVGVRQQLAWER